MKLKKPDTHGLSDKLFKHIPDKIRQYASNVYDSVKNKKMSRGALDIMRIITFARGDNWRQNHAKSEKKQHKK